MRCAHKVSVLVVGWQSSSNIVLQRAHHDKGQNAVFGLVDASNVSLDPTSKSKRLMLLPCLSQRDTYTPINLSLAVARTGCQTNKNLVVARQPVARQAVEQAGC